MGTRKINRKSRKSRKSKKRIRKTRSKRGGSGKGLPLPPSTSTPLPPNPPTTSPSLEKISSNEKKEEIDKCPICLNDVSKDDPSCKNGHHIHRKCLLEFCQSKRFNDVKCPLCRKDITAKCMEAQEEARKLGLAPGEVFDSKNIFIYINEIIKTVRGYYTTLKQMGSSRFNSYENSRINNLDIKTLRLNQYIVDRLEDRLESDENIDEKIKEYCIDRMYEILLNPNFDVNVISFFDVPDEPNVFYFGPRSSVWPDSLLRWICIKPHRHSKFKDASTLNEIFKPVIGYLLQSPNINVPSKLVGDMIDFNKELFPLFIKYKKIPKQLKSLI